MLLQMFTLVCVLLTLQVVYYQLKIRLKLTMVNNFFEKILSGIASGIMAAVLSFYSIEFSFDISIGLAVTSLLIGLIYSGQLTFFIGYTIYGIWYFMNPFNMPALSVEMYTLIGIVIFIVSLFIKSFSVYIKAILLILTYTALASFSIYLVSQNLHFTFITMSLYLILASISVYSGVIIISYMQNYVKMYERVESAANHDELTGLLNRRSFNRYLSEIDGNTATSLLLIDIDYFKMINDTYGHITGDMVLKKVSDTLKNVVPKDAPVGRVGGEEFSIILRDFSLSEVNTIAEKIRSDIEHLDIVANDNTQIVKITVSIGIAKSPEENTSIQELYDTADERLYIAKKLGRNQVQSCNPNEVIIKLK